MAKIVSIKEEQISAAESALKSLEENAERLLNTRQAIERLRPRVNELRKRGIPLDEIAKALNACGIQITEATLKSYLRKPGKTKQQARDAATREVRGANADAR